MLCIFSFTDCKEILEHVPSTKKVTALNFADLSLTLCPGRLCSDRHERGRQDQPGRDEHLRALQQPGDRRPVHPRGLQQRRRDRSGGVHRRPLSRRRAGSQEVHQRLRQFI